MDTASISYRVADFLKKHAPFHAVADADLLALTDQGRVRFYEPNEYILWQGEPHKAHVFVIQQGTVSLWDEAGERPELRDVRGPGDMLGLERYNDARSCLHTARSESDVVIYAFQTDDFETAVLKYPHAAQYVAAEGRVTSDYQPVAGRREPHRLFVHEFVGGRALAACSAQDGIADAAVRLLASGSKALAVLDEHHRARAVLTADDFLRWVANGGGDVQTPVERLVRSPPATIGPQTSVADGVLAMAAAGVDALAITADGTPAGSVQALVTQGDLGPLFGDDPTSLLREIRLAGTLHELQVINQRTRAFILEFLASAVSVEWLASYAHQIDVAILTRIGALVGAGSLPGCWSFCGSSGRAESLTLLAPHLLVILPDQGSQSSALDTFRRVLDGFDQCGYLPRVDLPREPDFYVATVSEWKERYRQWVTDPIMTQTFRVRTLFDLRAVCGDRSLWQAVETEVTNAVDESFLHVMANDCFDINPPLTFFQDAVVDARGEHSTTFQLEQSALRPLVDVGRVFGMAARQVLGRSTLERFASARQLLPERESIFREAADALRIVLWQQGRVGISQGTRGAELPPALLSRQDQRVLQSAFRSIFRLLEFTADREWLTQL